MANFRAERLFLRIEGSIDGFDPNEGIDADQFALIMILDQNAWDRKSLGDFTFAPFDKPRYSLASEGLEVVRAVIAEHEAKLNTSNEEQREDTEKTIGVLRAVEYRLDEIDLRGMRFYFLAKDID